MKRCILVVLIVSLSSCKQDACQWPGGEITDFGTYCNSGLEIKVYENDHHLNYQVRNTENEIIIEQDQSTSTFHHWGLFLDNQKNLWVFSSDIGDCVWRKDSATGKYHKKIFHHWLTRDSVPSEVYSSSMKRFIKDKL